jgi:hypothetical protein
MWAAWRRRWGTGTDGLVRRGEVSMVSILDAKAFVCVTL